jgi:hypothetical protein
MKNKIISIGYIGLKKCYLNIEESEAIQRYCISENITLEQFKKDDIVISTTIFDDEFGAYEIFE